MGLRTWIHKKTGIQLKNKCTQNSSTQQQAETLMPTMAGKTKEESFWIQEGVKHIIPNIGHNNPEGFDVASWIREVIGNDYPVLEIGCGVGRIASFFSASEYIGVDINPSAVEEAKKALPNHQISVIENGDDYPDASSVILYTVLLHISDENIEPFLSKVCENKNKIIIAELMDSRWVRDGSPPVFNRNPESYILLMQKLGFHLKSYDKKTYEHYNTAAWNTNKDTRITILTFER